jgi:3-oxoacyl-[acyl-carrier-protein] synthase II
VTAEVLGSVVAITGMGAVTPLGMGPEVLRRALEGAGQKTSRALTSGVVHDGVFWRCAPAAAFDPAQWLPARTARHFDRVTQLAVVAATAAWQQANPPADTDGSVAVVIGSGFGGLGTLMEQQRILEERGPRRVSPFMVPMMMANAPTAAVSLEIGARGPSEAVVTDALSSAQAVGLAVRMLERGDCVRAVAGGAESALLPVILKAVEAFGIDGEGTTVLGEGAAMVVLEPLAEAQRRRSPVYGTVEGYGESGAGVLEAMRRALADAGRDAAAVRLVLADGSPLAERAGEPAAIESLCGPYRETCTIRKTVDAGGHLWGAQGALGVVWATVQLSSVSHCGANAVALVNAVGVTGHAVSLVVGGPREVAWGEHTETA